MEKEITFGDITCNFNLRYPNREKASIVYLVVYLNGRQYKINTYVKVKPRHWNDVKSYAYIGFRLSAMDNINNLSVNKRIEEFRGRFQEFKAYICDNPSLLGDAHKILRRYMASSDKSSVSATKLLNEAFEKLYPIKCGTKRNNRYRLDAFLSYLKDNNLGDDAREVLSQPILDRYKSYLANKDNLGVCNINDKCGLVARIINNKLASDEAYRQYNIPKVSYVKLKDKRKREDTKKTSLTDSEIESLKQVELSPKLSEYRDIFLMLVYCGMRISDVEKVLNAPVCLDNNQDEE